VPSCGVAMFFSLVIGLLLLNPRGIVQPRHEIGTNILTILR
jgi:hypothetical protein